MKEIDARGLACPAPVLLTKAAVENDGETMIRVVLDNTASQQNVQRYLESKGFSVALETAGKDFMVTGRSTGAPDALRETEPLSSDAIGSKIMVLCATDRIGFGDDTLGKALMVNFIKTLKEMGPDLWRLVFVNNGVKLAVKDSPVLEELFAYEIGGLKILVCGTCLTHFNLLEDKKVGETTNMLDIVTAMQMADKVISMG
jgi:selenium metabolism protein YedF